MFLQLVMPYYRVYPPPAMRTVSHRQANCTLHPPAWQASASSFAVQEPLSPFAFDPSRALCYGTRMNILYGVVGEGMGHATRSEAVIRHLLAQGHKLVILASGKAEPYLSKAFAGVDAAQVDAIRGTFMKYDGNKVDRVDTVLSLIRALPTAAVVNFAEVKKLDAIHAIPERAFDAVVTDFETLAHLYGKLNKLPVINIDNMSVITRCDHHALNIPASYGFDIAVAAAITEAKVLATKVAAFGGGMGWARYNLYGKLAPRIKGLMVNDETAGAVLPLGTPSRDGGGASKAKPAAAPSVDAGKEAK